MIRSPESGVVYVLLATPRETDREHRVAELAARCWVARSLQPDATTVVGIASEMANDGKRGLSFDLVQIVMPNWTDEDQQQAERLQAEAGYFRSPKMTSATAYEYPQA